MDRKHLVAGLGLLLMGGLTIPVHAYHIDLITDPAPTNPADWVLGTTSLITCESNGPHDDRLDRPGPVSGGGGLCTTGENDATGRLPPGQTSTSAATAAGLTGTEYTMLDVCDAPRESWTGTTCSTGTSSKAGSLPGSGSTIEHHYTVELGVYACEIPRQGSLTTDPVTNLPVENSQDYAFFYSRLYAYWSYDGTAPYTAGDVAGAVHEGGVVTPASNNEDAWHGHVSVFIDSSLSRAGHGTIGSVQTSSTPHFGTLSDSYTPGLSPAGAWSNTCGGSPAASPMTGPVYRAAY